jgi:hypothetical protein
MESSSYRTRSVGWRSSELGAPTQGPLGPGPPRPLLDPRGPMLGASGESPKLAETSSAWSLRSGTTCCRGPARRSIYTGARARTAGWGRGCRPRPLSGGPALPHLRPDSGLPNPPYFSPPTLASRGSAAGCPVGSTSWRAGFPAESDVTAAPAV